MAVVLRLMLWVICARRTGARGGYHSGKFGFRCSFIVISRNPRFETSVRLSLVSARVRSLCLRRFEQLF